MNVIAKFTDMRKFISFVLLVLLTSECVSLFVSLREFFNTLHWIYFSLIILFSYAIIISNHESASFKQDSFDLFLLTTIEDPSAFALF
jgi:hypothetical protein